MLIDDIVMSGKQSIYSVDIMQIRKRNASLVRRSIASSFNYSPSSQAKKRKRLLAVGVKVSGLVIPYPV